MTTRKTTARRQSAKDKIIKERAGAIIANAKRYDADTRAAALWVASSIARVRRIASTWRKLVSVTGKDDGASGTWSAIARSRHT